jgi:hypothetical protein
MFTLRPIFHKKQIPSLFRRLGGPLGLSADVGEENNPASNGHQTPIRHMYLVTLLTELFRFIRVYMYVYVDYAYSIEVKNYLHTPVCLHCVVLRHRDNSGLFILLITLICQGTGCDS